METSLQGRRALVTGAASGIGAAIAEAFAREGAHVAVHARSDERAGPTVAAIEAAGGRAFAAAADLRDRAAIGAMCAAAIERLGGLDILVNNAGTFIRKPVAEMDLADWDSMVETNLTAAFLATRASLPAIRASGGGASVIFVSSIAAGAYSAGWGTYAMTKNGLNAFMHCLADELGGSGVRVNAICPGWVETKMAQDAHRGLAADLGLDYKTHYAQNMRANMLGALVTTDSVADIAVFLASERGRHITAQELTVCGGCLPGASAQPEEAAEAP
ncbi:MAG: SDR family oxidoreductase [Rhodospirillales bacterium]|nr:SDR family oxidoreductase [Rhodospirillales bacterium]MDE0380343.1 SDR family oxidoreductase [Rhodospirillales bacterium]